MMLLQELITCLDGVNHTQSWRFCSGWMSRHLSRDRFLVWLNCGAEPGQRFSSSVSLWLITAGEMMCAPRALMRCSLPSLCVFTFISPVRAYRTFQDSQAILCLHSRHWDTCINCALCQKIIYCHSPPTLLSQDWSSADNPLVAPSSITRRVWKQGVPRL